MKSKMSVLIFYIFFSVFSAEAWVGIEKANRTKIRDSGEGWHCSETTHNLGPLGKGDVTRIEGMCKVAVCLESGDVLYKGCPMVMSHRCSVEAGDLSKEYPHCCLRVTCNKQGKS